MWEKRKGAWKRMLGISDWKAFPLLWPTNGPPHKPSYVEAKRNLSPLCNLKSDCSIASVLTPVRKFGWWVLRAGLGPSIPPRLTGHKEVP